MGFLLLGVGLLHLLKLLPRTIFLYLLLLMPVSYMVTRGSGPWDGQSAVNLAESIVGPDRAQSLDFRFYNENFLVEGIATRGRDGNIVWAKPNLNAVTLNNVRRRIRELPTGGCVHSDTSIDPVLRILVDSGGDTVSGASTNIIKGIMKAISANIGISLTAQRNPKILVDMEYKV